MATNSFPPGTIVEIIAGPLAGTRGEVSWGRAAPGFVDLRLDTRTTQIDASQVRALEGKDDPWYPKFEQWTTSPEGRAHLVEGALTTGEILEVLGLEDGFGNHMRATKILALLGCTKQEALRGAWVWRSPAAAEPAVEKTAASPLGFVLAFNYFLAWLRSMPAIVKIVFDQVALICLRHNRFAKPEVARWFRQGGVVLEQLRRESVESAVHDLQDVFFVCVESFAKDEVRLGIEADQLHRQLIATLVSAKQSQQGGEPLERTPEVNGWLLALARMVPLSLRESIAAEDAGDTTTAGEFQRQAEALQWIVDAVGGGPWLGEVVVPPKANLLGSDWPDKKSFQHGPLGYNEAKAWAHDLVDSAFAQSRAARINGELVSIMGAQEQEKLRHRIAMALQVASGGHIPAEEANGRSWNVFLNEYDIIRFKIYKEGYITDFVPLETREAVMKAVDLVATFKKLDWRAAARQLLEAWFRKRGKDRALVAVKHALKYFVFDCAETAELVLKDVAPHTDEAVETEDKPAEAP